MGSNPGTELSIASNDDNTPFTIGYCSGILKVTNDVLRFHGATAIRRYRIEIQLRDADDNIDYFDNNNDDNDGTSCTSDTGYCQKTTNGVVYVDIQNRNDPPKIFSSDNIFDVDEDKPVGSSIGWLTYTDEDSEDSHSFRISELDAHDAIKVEARSGELKILRALNYEKKKTYTLKVVVTDSGGWRNIPLSAECRITININNKNDAPVLPETLTLSINEDSDVNKWVNGYTDLMGKGIGSDEDDLNNDTSNSMFKSPLSCHCVSGECGTGKIFDVEESSESSWGVKLKEEVNFELKSSYVLNILAKDKDEVSSNIMKLTVEVVDDNESPTLKTETFQVKEDVEKGHVFGDSINCVTDSTALCFDEDEDQSHQFFLDNTDSPTAEAPFSIDAKLGQLKTTDTLDYEKDSSYTIKVIVRDDGIGKLEHKVDWTVEVEDVNEDPEIDDNQERELSEDAEIDAVAQADLKDTEDIDTTDDSTDKIKYSDPDTKNSNFRGAKFKIKSGDPDGAFKIDDGFIKVKDSNILDYEDKKKYTLLIEITDDANGTSSSSIDVHIRDANEAPSLKYKKDAQGDEIKPVERDIDEGSNYNAKVGDVIQCLDDDSEDNDSNDDCTATCKIVAHHDKEDGTNITEYFMFGLDDDDKSTNQLRVRDRCGKHKCDNDDDTDCCEKSSSTEDEKEYNDCCRIPLQKNLKNVYVRVTCEDTGKATSSPEYIKVEINEVNEKPDIEKKNFTIYEDLKKGAKVGKMKATDQEVSEGSQSLTWSITKGNSNKIFSIDSGTGQIKIDDPAELNFEELNDDGDEAEIELTIKVEDNDAANPASDSEKIFITVLDVNEKPELDADDFTGEVKENDSKGKKIGDPLKDFDDVDPENKTLTYTIVAGNDDGLFKCEKENGQIKLDVDGKLDYETKKEYEITVRIHEPEAESSTSYRGNTHVTKGGKPCQAWSDQSPRKHSFTPTKYPSAGLKDTSSCRDPDGKGTIWCFTSEGDKEWDYCTQQHTYDAKLTIDVKDVNEAPTVKMPNEKVTIYEDAGDDDKVGKSMKGEDQDSGDTITYKFKDASDGENTFKIHSTSGQISVRNSKNLDFESQKIYTPTVIVTDSKGLTGEVKCKLHVLDVNEHPEVSDVEVSIAEDSQIDEVITTLVVEDPDVTDRHTCVILSGNNNDAFTLDSKDHTLAIRNTSAIDYEGGNTKYTLEVKCSDTNKLSDTATVTAKIYNVPEPPTIESALVYINENTAENVLVFQSDDLVYRDQDDGGDISKHKIRIIGGDPGKIFKLEGNKVMVNKRQWSHENTDDSSTWNKPVVISGSSDIGKNRINCPANFKILFGFAMQQSARDGVNVYSKLVLKSALHTKEATGSQNIRLTKLKQLTWGEYSVSNFLQNGRFYEDDETTTSYTYKSPKFWRKHGKVAVIKNGDKNIGFPDGSLEYYVGLIGSGSAVYQSLSIPVNSHVQVVLGVASKTKKETFEVHVGGYGRIFPPSGGVKNCDFNDGVSHNTYRYVTPKGWRKGSSKSHTLVIRSCNGMWGGLCTGSFSRYYLGIHNRGSDLWQRVTGLEISKSYKATFFAAARPGNWGEQRLGVYLIGKEIKKMHIEPNGNFSKYESDEVLPRSDGTIIIYLRNDSPKGDKAVFVDSIVLQKVGENP